MGLNLVKIILFIFLSSFLVLSFDQSDRGGSNSPHAGSVPQGFLRTGFTEPETVAAEGAGLAEEAVVVGSLAEAVRPVVAAEVVGQVAVC